MTTAERKEPPRLAELRLEASPPVDGTIHLFEEHDDEALCLEKTVRRGAWYEESGERMRSIEDLDISDARIGDERPEGVCPDCWKPCNEIAPHLLPDPAGRDLSSESAFRIRWEQTGESHSEWYDIVCHESASIDQIDSMMTRAFSSYSGEGLRLYGPGSSEEYLPDAYVPTGFWSELPPGLRRIFGSGETSLGKIQYSTGLGVGDRMAMVDGLFDLTPRTGVLKEELSHEESLECFDGALAHNRCVAVVDEHYSQPKTPE